MDQLSSKIGQDKAESFPSAKLLPFKRKKIIKKNMLNKLVYYDTYEIFIKSS